MIGRRRSDRAAALERLHEDNAADLLSYFGRRVAVSADAADLLSETFLVTWRRIDDVPVDPERARMWLFGVARRVVANSRRGHGRHTELALKLRGHLVAGADEPIDAEVLDVRAAVDALPADQAELVRLLLWDGFTLAEAATILGIRESTARGRYARGRARLRHVLEPEHEEDRRRVLLPVEATS